MIPVFWTGSEYLIRVKDLEGQPKTNDFSYLLKILKTMGTNQYSEDPKSEGLENSEVTETTVKTETTVETTTVKEEPKTEE